MNLNQWIDYGRDLAVKHEDLLHQDEKGRRTFALVDIEEMFSDTSGLEGDTVLRWALPTFVLSDPGGNPHEVYQAAFLVLCKKRRGDSISFTDAVIKAKSISDDIIARMLRDAEEEVDLFMGADSLEELKVSGVAMKNEADGSYNGWLTTLTFMNFFTKEAKNCDGTSKWTDL